MKTRAKTLYPFVPSGREFEKSIAFFGELGFVKIWGDDTIAGLKFDGAYFLLQNVNEPVWQKNQMLTYEVDQLDGYWSELSPKNLEASYPGVKIGPPKDFPWGREMHIIDLAGVCWHVRQTAG